MNKQYLDRPKGGRDHMICPLRVKKKNPWSRQSAINWVKNKAFVYMLYIFKWIIPKIIFIPRTHSLCREENRWRKGLGKSRVNSLRIKTSHAAKKLRALCLSLPPAVLLHCLPGKRPWYQDTGHHTKNCQGVLTGMSHEVSRANKAGKKKEKET